MNPMRGRETNPLYHFLVYLEGPFIFTDNPIRKIILMSSVSSTGEFSPNFDLKNMISAYTKHFSNRDLSREWKGPEIGIFGE
jgi:hypothetical protein